ncbi:MAG: hypothetical protein DMF69_21055 [Acidobacteria bacterium]|nr:MAG: hypothetical protein DMF69_21055 [Acidobacteriota bacterium]
MRNQKTKSEIFTLSGVLILYLFGVVQVGIVHTVSAQDLLDAQPHANQARLAANDGVTLDSFGNAVAISNNTAVVGAFGQPNQNNRGGAYGFVRNGVSWSQQQALVPSDLVNGDRFGNSVAIDADTIVVGAPIKTIGVLSGKGAAYVFVRNGTTWTQQQRLTASDGALGDNFGTAVTISGNTIIVGAINHAVGGNSRQGAAYVFVRSGSNWTEQQKLTAGDGLMSDQLGGAVDLVGNTAVVGARENNFGANRNGKVYVFLRSGTTWTQQQKLTAASGSPLDAFGNSVAISPSADTIAVGALNDEENQISDRGSAYVFVLNGSTWSEQQRLVGSLGVASGFNAHFGTSVDVDGDTVIVGSPELDPLEGNGRGAVYVFQRSVSTWTEQERIVFSPASLRHFGTSVAMSGDAFIGGAPFENGSTGAAYVFATGAASTVQFSASNYSVQEDCTAVTVTVNRSGDTSAAANVNYFTSDISATDRSDYIAAAGTLRFAAGESSISFPLLINEDSFAEGTETFNVTLNNPSGMSLGTPFVATVTIDDDLNEPTNVIDNPRNLVGQHYHDFLLRQPDSSGWDFWTNEITSCGSDAQCIEVKRINVSAAFYLSIEFQETGFLVERIYKSAYGDGIGTSTWGGSHQLPVPIVRFNEFLSDTRRIGEGVIVGATGWEQLLESKKQSFLTEFVQRARLTTAFPTTLTPAQFVDQLNTNAGNALSASERDAAIALFGGAANTSNTTARAQALRQLAEDQSLRTAEFNRAFVLMQYFGYLRRNPNEHPDIDYTGFDFWLTKLNQFNGNFVQAEMIKAFIVSGEYRQRFGQ